MIWFVACRRILRGFLFALISEQFWIVSAWALHIARFYCGALFVPIGAIFRRSSATWTACFRVGAEAWWRPRWKFRRFVRCCFFVFVLETNPVRLFVFWTHKNPYFSLIIGIRESVEMVNGDAFLKSKIRCSLPVWPFKVWVCLGFFFVIRGKCLVSSTGCFSVSSVSLRVHKGFVHKVSVIAIC